MVVAFDGFARLVVKDELPFIAIPCAFFAHSNALPAMGDLLVALYRGLEHGIQDKDIILRVA